MAQRYVRSIAFLYGRQRGLGVRKYWVAPVLILAACSGDSSAQREAREAVAHGLRDPASAQFRELAVYPGYVCGEINGKNAIGAYAGYRRFWFNRKDKSYGIDPQSENGDGIARTNQRDFEGAIETFCK